MIVSARALSDDDYNVRSFEDFDVYMYSSSLLFGLNSDAYNYVALEPLNWTAINGTNCHLWMAPMYGGQFYFEAQEDAVFQFNTNMENLGGVRFNGAPIGDGDQVLILSGSKNTVEWSYTMAPLIPLVLLLGLMGVGMGLGGPFYIIYKWRDDHDINGMVAGTVITLLGFAFIIGWLWL